MNRHLFHGACTARFLTLAKRGELAALHSFAFLYLFTAGGGEWSVPTNFGKFYENEKYC